MFKKIIMEVETDKIVFNLFSKNKLILRNSVLVNDISHLQNVLQQYYNMGFKKVFVVLKNDVPNYKITQFKNTNKKQITYLAKLNMMKHFYVLEKDYYFDTCILNRDKNTFDVLIVIANKEKIDRLIDILMKVKFEVKNISTYHIEVLNFFEKQKVDCFVVQNGDYLYIVTYEKNTLNNITKIDIFDKNYLKNEILKINDESMGCIYLIDDVDDDIVNILKSKKIIRKKMTLSSKGYM